MHELTCELREPAIRFHARNAGGTRDASVAMLLTSVFTVCSNITDRSERLDVRTRIYSGVMVLAKAISHDQRAMLDRSRTFRRRSLILAALGLLGIGMTLVANGWTEIPG